MSDPNYENYDPLNALVLKIATVALVVGADVINAQRSTVGFGVWFTFLQYVAAIGIIVLIFIIFSQIRTKGVLSNMTR